jgi:protein tyrosine phosphatase (PTP) superfamily phosphohydrolase (DUF442 family)
MVAFFPTLVLTPNPLILYTSSRNSIQRVLIMAGNFFYKKIYLILILLLFFFSVVFFFWNLKSTSPSPPKLPTSTPTSLISPSPVILPSPKIEFVGPRQNIPKDTPAEAGFWSFAVIKNSILSRSGQPTLKEFEWLKKKGWKSIVNLRKESDDLAIDGFSSLGFNYLHLPIQDGLPPTDDQAKKFLEFVQNPSNWPIHIHCRGGIGRAGVMVALYRVKIDNWSKDEAIEESRQFLGGISKAQENWLLGFLKREK